MEYYAKFIDYRTEVVTRADAIHALLDFETKETTVFVAGARLVARGHEECALAFGALQSQQMEFASAAQKTHGDEEGQVELGVGEAQLIVSPGVEATEVIRRLLARYRHVGSVIREVEKIGRAIVRQPYSEYVREFEETGFRRVTLYSLANFRSGRLQALRRLMISGQFSPREKIDIRVRSIIKLPPYRQSRKRRPMIDPSIQQPHNPPSVIIEQE